MSSPVVKQIERRMTALKLNPKSLSQKAKLNDTAVRDIIEGRSKNPRHDTLQKIAKALGCTVGDLSGERPDRSTAERRSHGDVVEILELDVHAAAGVGADADMAILAQQEVGAILGVHSMPSSSFREAYGVASDRIRIIPVKGNSMEPVLWPGQRVMVDITDKVPSPPGIFVIWDGLALVLKFVEVIPNSEPLRVRISSANKHFKEYERTLEEAHINGRIVGVWARM